MTDTVPSAIAVPVLVANGDDDRMVPTSNTVDMNECFPGSRITIYPDARHGGIFQYHERFVPTLIDFLAA